MRVFAVSSGKGGVGKTSLVINLALALSEQGERVVVFDADLGLANVDVMLGLSPPFDIRYVLKGEKTLSEILYKTEYNFSLIPASSGNLELTQLNLSQKLLLKAQLEEILKKQDFLIFDISAGISENVLFFNFLAEERIVIATSEPTSLADAYALIKVAFKKYKIKDFYLLLNMVKEEREGKKIYQQLIYVLEKFLPEIKLSYLGAIPFDECVSKAVKLQIPFLKLCPLASVSQKVREVALKLIKVSPKGEDHLEVFLEKWLSL
ncbi:MAG: MinD/ParA family protein [Thermodesulfobacteriaceae bacterium]|nr:MinD/ParA family protein [Thermodesulfobacteriaceae bacterium]MDW8135855.1 MinD/ParA family protein [Thermodesulfobacterium sp.]